MNKFTRADVDVLEETVSYNGFFQIRTLNLRHRLFQGGWSKSISRELFERDDAVGVLLFDPVRDEVALVEQFRVGVLGSGIAKQDNFSPWIMELVAGLIDKEEAVDEVARRESLEEAGAVVEQLEPIGQYYSSPGSSNEYFHLFIGKTDLSGAGGIHGLDEEGEDIRVQVVPVSELWLMLERGELINAHTLIAVQWLRLNHQRLCSQWR